MCKSLCIPVLTLILAVAGLSCGKKMKMPEIDMGMSKLLEGEKPEEKVRKQIAEVLKAEELAKYFNEISDLLDLARQLKWDNRQLLAEVVDYSSRLESGGEAMARYRRLLETLEIPRSTIVEVAAQRLESGDAKGTDVNRTLLRWAAPPELRRSAADYSHFRHYLEMRQGEPPTALVLWMYQNDPSAALREMMAVYGQGLSREEAGAILLGEHLVSDMLARQSQHLLAADETDPAAVAQLEKLSQSSQWWVRLYVAEVLARYPRLRSDALVQRLSSDEHVLVKRAMQPVSGR